MIQLHFSVNQLKNGATISCLCKAVKYMNVEGLQSQSHSYSYNRPVLFAMYPVFRTVCEHTYKATVTTAR